jgi:hypothetical protein
MLRIQANKFRFCNQLVAAPNSLRFRNGYIPNTFFINPFESASFGLGVVGNGVV